jgi:hypothetical protein
VRPLRRVQVAAAMRRRRRGSEMREMSERLARLLLGRSIEIGESKGGDSEDTSKSRAEAKER